LTPRLTARVGPLGSLPLARHDESDRATARPAIL